ncbi:Ganglioside-induced differentiation-associated protein 2 [Branchiostoma belcheri]|nr:Ganglioside-induced differentiation-associated protein 2 [Branchiostoma belcheri]
MSSTIQYLSGILASIDKATDTDTEVFVLGDINIDWADASCPTRKHLVQAAERCNLVQIVKGPSRVGTNKNNQQTATCIDLAFVNCKDRCTPARFVPVGYSDHNIIYLTRKAKVPKSQVRVVFKRIYGKFSLEEFQTDIAEAPWHLVYNEADVNDALHVFTTMFNNVADHHAPVKTRTLRSNPAAWLDDELREMMQLRDDDRRESSASGLQSDKDIYKKLLDLLREELHSQTGDNTLHVIKEKIMMGKDCTFDFKLVNATDVHTLLLSLSDGKAVGLDNVDNKLMRIAADHIAAPLTYIINLSFATSVYPTDWNRAKVVPIPKSVTAPFSGPNI